MNRAPLLKTFVPLAVAMASCLAFVAYTVPREKWPIDDLALNLASELFGIILTVWFVDQILKRHEQQRWTPVDETVASVFRISLQGLAREAAFQGIAGPAGTLELDRDTLLAGASADAIYKRLSSLDRNQLSLHCDRLQSYHSEIQTLLLLHSQRLTPDVVSSVLRVLFELARTPRALMEGERHRDQLGGE